MPRTWIAADNMMTFDVVDKYFKFFDMYLIAKIVIYECFPTNMDAICIRFFYSSDYQQYF